MQFPLLFHMLLISFFAPINDVSDCKTEALIIGKDFTKCGCCGGWMIKVEEKVYLTDKIASMDLKMEPGFPSLLEEPIKIKISFDLKDGGCGNRIVVYCLEEIRAQVPD